MNPEVEELKKVNNTLISIQQGQARTRKLLIFFFLLMVVALILEYIKVRIKYKLLISEVDKAKSIVNLSDVRSGFFLALMNEYAFFASFVYGDAKNFPVAVRMAYYDDRTSQALINNPSMLGTMLTIARAGTKDTGDISADRILCDTFNDPPLIPSCDPCRGSGSAEFAAAASKISGLTGSVGFAFDLGLKTVFKGAGALGAAVGLGLGIWSYYANKKSDQQNCANSTNCVDGACK